MLLTAEDDEMTATMKLRRSYCELSMKILLTQCIKQKGRKMFSKLLKILGVVTLFGAGAHAYAEQGITDTEIIIGSNQDMSGPFAGFGAPGMSATKQYFDKINAKEVYTAEL